MGAHHPPNILWILATQWRAQACGYAGDTNAATPRLDALAAEGVDFRQAVTPHPFGPFARAALLTGVPSPENGVRDYFDPLPAGARTVAHELAERGYATAFFGKWHLGPRDPAAPPVGEAAARRRVPPEHRGGFAVWEGFDGGFLLNDPWLHGTRLPEPARFPGYQADVLAARAAGWIRSDPGPAGPGRSRKPWFCVVSLEPPHPPYGEPAAGIAPADPKDLALRPNVPRGGEAEARARRELSGYYAHLAATDRAIGRLLDRVERGSTWIVFTSVHGDMHGAHGLFRKGWPHEESVRVPLLVRPPPGGRGRADDAPVSLLDLPRLALDWADGRDAAEPPWQNRAWQRLSMPSVPPFPLQCDRVWRGWRSPERKLVLGPDGAPWLFFDLKDDPGEERNLAANPARAGEIARLRGAAERGKGLRGPM